MSRRARDVASTGSKSTRQLGSAEEAANASLKDSWAFHCPGELTPLTPNSLRQTFTTMLYALGETPPWHGGNGTHQPGARAEAVRATDAPTQ